MAGNYTFKFRAKKLDIARGFKVFDILVFQILNGFKTICVNIINIIQVIVHPVGLISGSNSVRFWERQHCS